MSELSSGVDALPFDQALRLAGALRAEALERAANDGLFYASFVKTRDEADPDHSVKPFPVHLEYVQAIWKALIENQCVVIAKSRQMLMSWIACVFCSWWARFKSNQAVAWQTQKWEDACEKVAMAGVSGDTGGYMGRIQFIEYNLPGWLKQPIRATEGRITYSNGSVIEALAGGADKIRGKVASVIVEDEFAFQPEARGVYTAVAPLIQKATKFIAISTPNGGEGSIFYHIFHGIPFPNV